MAAVMKAKMARRYNGENGDANRNYLYVSIEGA